MAASNAVTTGRNTAVIGRTDRIVKKVY